MHRPHAVRDVTNRRTGGPRSGRAQPPSDVRGRAGTAGPLHLATPERERHAGTVAAGGEVEIEARAWSAGIAAVREVGLAKWDWATLLQRVWDVDALKCEGCGGRMRFIAVIKDRAVIERILRHIGEDADEPRFARARDPCDAWA